MLRSLEDVMEALHQGFLKEIILLALLQIYPHTAMLEVSQSCTCCSSLLLLFSICFTFFDVANGNLLCRY
jgi:hypothetical protein